MKSVIRIISLTLVAGLFACPGLWAQDKERAYVDAYSSASTTKTMLAGAAFDAAAEALQAGSSDLATMADAKAPGYTARRGTVGNVMSANPDGSVGISTINLWAYFHESGDDTLKVQMAYGQTTQNIAEVGRRGTLFVSDLTVGDKAVKYFVHFKVIDVDTLEYSDEAYAAGMFNTYYSAKTKKTQFTFTCKVLAIEDVSASVKLGTKM